MDPELAAAAPSLTPSDLSDAPAARALNRRRHAEDAAYEGHHRLEVTEHYAIGPYGRIPVRVYRPREASGPLPGVLWLHGGAFSLGDLDASDAWCAQISDRVGAVVVNVDYRLAPEHPYPAGLTDSYAALEWLTSPAGHLGVDAARIAVAGSSAGGCLAAGVALLARDREGPAIRHQLLIYPVLDDRCATASARHAVDVPVFTAASNRTMWEVYLAGGPVDGYAAPARAENLSELPSAFVLAAQHDPLLDEAIEYAGRLAAAGVRVDLRVAAGAFHGFDAVVPHAAVSRRAQDACLGALARELARDVSREPVEAACARR